MPYIGHAFWGLKIYHIHCIDSNQKSRLPAVDWQRKGGEYMKKFSNRSPKNFKQYQQTPDGKIKTQFESENKKCDKFWRKK
jgi:hypothetical protein